MKTALLLILAGVFLLAVGWEILGLIVGLIGGFIGIVLGLVAAVAAILLPFAIIGLILFVLFKIVKAVLC